MAGHRVPRGVRVALLAAVVLFSVLVTLTVAALEGGEVVVVRTMDPSGNPRTTRTWAVDAEGAVWIEAANPERCFLRDLRVRPDLELRRGGASEACVVTILPNPEGHVRIRSLLRGRYGWRDAWIGMLANTEQSVALRLVCG